MINMLRALMDKQTTYKEQMSNINRQIETLRKDHKETLGIKKLEQK